jgi:serine/threonine protein kinase
MEEFNKVKPKKIKLEEYQMDRTLGSGSFGRVKLAKHKNDDFLFTTNNNTS